MKMQVPNMQFIHQFFETELIDFHKIPCTGIAILVHYNFFGPQLFYSSYSDAWLDEYGRNQYFFKDPVILTMLGAKQDITFRWSELPFPDAAGIFRQSARFGILKGLVVIRVHKAARSMCAIAHPSLEFSMCERIKIEKIFDTLLRKHNAKRNITAKQTELLRCLSAGASISEASVTLSVSESALKSRLSNLKSRLECDTTAQAIHLSTKLGLI